MNTIEQSTSNLKEMNAAASDLFQKNSKLWLDLISNPFAKSDEVKQSGQPLFTTEILKVWSNGFFDGNGQRAKMQKILAANLEQQKLCANLTTSWFTCATKMMEAIRNGAKNNNDQAETLKACQDIAAEYSLSCADFIENECAQICDVLRSHKASEEKSEKAETVKSKAKAEK